MSAKNGQKNNLKGKKDIMKEQYEWIQSWSDEADKSDLPRVLLVGDSITRAYQGFVRTMLKDKYYVDYLSTSYAIDSPLFHTLIESFAKDNRYDVIHFNHGLHGKHMTKEVYEEGVEKLLNSIKTEGCRIIVALTTITKTEGNVAINESWQSKIIERNAAALSIAEKHGYAVDDLYTLSVEMPNEFRSQDGTHYQDEGSQIFAKSVVNSIVK